MTSSRRKLLALGAAAVLAVAGLGWWALAPKGGAMPTANISLTAMSANAGTVAEHPEGYFELTLGAEDAPITFIEYGSFTCPHCARHHMEVFPRLMAEYIETGKMRYIYREVYFDRFGLWAGIVARCAGPERYKGMVELLYARQDDWARGQSDAQIFENLRRLGRVAGMSDDQIDACAADEDMARMLVTVYQRNAAADDITSTPSFVINGRRHGNMAYSEMQRILDGLIDG